MLSKTALRNKAHKECTDQGHRMSPFIIGYGGRVSHCKDCGLAQHFNEQSGKIWGEAGSTPCKKK